MRTVVFSQVSIDGKLTLGKGNSSKNLFESFKAEDFEFIHKFRGQVDGIMVGKKTVDVDNPFLTNRYDPDKSPVRIVPTSTMDISQDSNVFNDNGKTIIVTCDKGFKKDKYDWIKKKNKECIVCGKRKVDFRQLFKNLQAQHNINSVMVEGGGELNWQIFNAGLVDEIIIMQLPIIIGGASTPTLADGLGYEELCQTKKFKVEEIKFKQNYTMMHFVKAAS